MEALNPVFDPALLSRIEDAGLNASAPPEQRWLDGWLLRLSPGKAKRARCVNAVAPGRLPIADKLATSERAFVAAGLPMIVRITPFTLPVALDWELEARGLQRFDDTHVMLLQLDSLPGAELPAGASLQPLGAEAFAQHIGALRGSPLAQQRAHSHRLLHSPLPFSAWKLHVEGRTLACGQFAIQDDLVGLYDVFTAPDERGQGHAGALCRQMLLKARQLGSRHAYLQVEADNRAAQAVYRRLGFTDAYAYHYRARDPAQA